MDLKNNIARIKLNIKMLGFIFFTFAFSSNVFATVEYLMVNHITKELYWSETDHPPGIIAWNHIPHGKWEASEIKYQNEGYITTTFPYKIDVGILVALTLVIIGTLKFLRIKKRALLP